jgi:hypothetical protein
MNGITPLIAAGVIGVIAVVVFVFLVGSSFNRLFISESTKPDAEGITTPIVGIDLDKVNITDASNDTAIVQVSFAGITREEALQCCKQCNIVCLSMAQR